MKFYNGFIDKLEDNQIFVFGSNPEGRHGAGTAKVANTKFGAIYWQGRGLQGQSYALPTKNLKKNYKEKSTGIVYEKAGEKSLTPEQIIQNIEELYSFAIEKPNLEFLIAYQNVSRNLNGYSSSEILQFFIDANNGNIPENIVLSDTFKNLFEEKTLSNTRPTDPNDFTIDVVNIKKTPDVKNKKSYIYCGRGSALGNPFAMKDYSNDERERVCREYEEYLPLEMKKNQKVKDQLNLIWKTGRENGEVQLGCYCFPQKCHCDTVKDTLLKKQQELKKKKDNNSNTDNNPTNEPRI